MKIKSSRPFMLGEAYLRWMLIRKPGQEPQQHIAVLLQTRYGIGILDTKAAHEQVEGFDSLDSGGCHPDVVQHGGGLAVQVSGHLAQHVDRHVHPATLAATGGDTPKAARTLGSSAISASWMRSIAVSSRFRASR